MSSSGNLKLAFIIEAVDRATAPILRVQERLRGVTRSTELVAARQRLGGAWQGLIAFGTRAVQTLTAVAGAGAAAAFGMNRVVNRVSAVADQAIKLGMTTEAFTRLTFAAGQAGSAPQTMALGLEMLSTNMQAAIDGSKEAQMWFGRVGLSLADLRKMNAGEVFRTISNQFERVGDAGGNAEKKIALMRALMGRSGADLIQLANGGAAGLDEMAKRSDELGNTLDGKTGAAMKRVGDQVDELQSSIGGLSTRITAAALPAMSRLVDRLTRAAVAGQADWATRLGTALGALMEPLPAVITGLADLFTGIVKVAVVINRVVDATVGWNSILAVVVGVIGGSVLFAVYSFATALWAVAAAVLAIAAPFAPIIAAGLALAALAGLIYEKWEPIRKFFGSLFGDDGPLGKNTNMPAAGAPSIYAGADAWDAYRAQQGGGAIQPQTAKVGGTLRVEVVGPGRVTSVQRAQGSGMDIDAYSGAVMAGP